MSRQDAIGRLHAACGTLRGPKVPPHELIVFLVARGSEKLTHNRELEPDPKVRLEARRLLSRQLDAWEYEGGKRGYPDFLIQFYSEDPVHCTPSSDIEGVRKFLAQCWTWNCRHGGMYNRRQLIIPALVNAGCHPLLLSERIVDAVPVLYQWLCRALDRRPDHLGFLNPADVSRDLWSSNQVTLDAIRGVFQCGQKSDDERCAYLQGFAGSILANSALRDLHEAARTLATLVALFVGRRSEILAMKPSPAD